MPDAWRLEPTRWRIPCSSGVFLAVGEILSPRKIPCSILFVNGRVLSGHTFQGHEGRLDWILALHATAYLSPNSIGRSCCVAYCFRVKFRRLGKGAIHFSVETHPSRMYAHPSRMYEHPSGPECGDLRCSGGEERDLRVVRVGSSARMSADGHAFHHVRTALSQE